MDLAPAEAVEAPQTDDLALRIATELRELAGKVERGNVILVAFAYVNDDDETISSNWLSRQGILRLLGLMETLKLEAAVRHTATHVDGCGHATGPLN